MTDMTIGFSTAFEIAAQSIDRLHSTAHSHHRILVVEMMGRNAGWLTLAAGVTGGADVIVIPEIPYDRQKIALAIQKRKEAGKQFSIVAVAERIISQEQVEFIQYLKDINEMKHSGEEQEQVAERLERLEMRFTDSTLLLANRLEKYTGLETRITILGYLLRGGAPSAGDRMLATEFGTACVSLVNSNCFGIMIAKHGSKVEPVDLEQVVGKEKPVPLDHSWILSARAVGTQFGD
jgi:6-phosphofructokinase